MMSLAQISFSPLCSLRHSDTDKKSCYIYRVGMIEWMDKTIPLKDKLESAMTDAEHKAYIAEKYASYLLLKKALIY